MDDWEEWKKFAGFPQTHETLESEIGTEKKRSKTRSSGCGNSTRRQHELQFQTLKFLSQLLVWR